MVSRSNIYLTRKIHFIASYLLSDNLFGVQVPLLNNTGETLYVCRNSPETIEITFNNKTVLRCYDNKEQLCDELVRLFLTYPLSVIYDIIHYDGGLRPRDLTHFDKHKTNVFYDYGKGLIESKLLLMSDCGVNGVYEVSSINKVPASKWKFWLRPEYKHIFICVLTSKYKRNIKWFIDTPDLWN